jgi:hypothetical protein
MSKSLTPKQLTEEDLQTLIRHARLDLAGATVVDRNIHREVLRRLESVIADHDALVGEANKMQTQLATIMNGTDQDFQNKFAIFMTLFPNQDSTITQDIAEAKEVYSQLKDSL